MSQSSAVAEPSFPTRQCTAMPCFELPVPDVHDELCMSFPDGQHGLRVFCLICCLRTWTLNGPAVSAQNCRAEAPSYKAKGGKAKLHDTCTAWEALSSTQLHRDLDSVPGP